MKVCTNCDEELPFDMFYKHKRHADGYNSRCKNCHKLTLVSGDKKASYDKEYRKANPEKYREYESLRSKTPHRRALKNEHTRRRKISIFNATPADYDREGVIAMYKLAQKISNLTGVKMHVDHIVPISVGGVHDVYNLQLLEETLNIKKGANKDWQLSWSKYPVVGVKDK